MCKEDTSVKQNLIIQKFLNSCGSFYCCLHIKLCYSVFSAAVDHGPPSRQLRRNNIIDVIFVIIVIIVIVKASIFSAEQFISNKQTLTEQDCNFFLILPAGVQQ